MVQMSATTLIRLIDCLGKNHDFLVSEHLISSSPLKPLVDSPDNTDLIHNPMPGVKLWFSTETKAREKVMITLIGTVGQKTYNGELPSPLQSSMDQNAVRNLFGTPASSKQPTTLPAGLGVRGGSGTFHLDPQRHSNTQITFGYMETLKINNICFSRISKQNQPA